MNSLGKEIVFLDSTASTNTYAAALVESGEASHGTVVAAGFQTSGKGQAGNKWESEKDKNLTFSIVLFPERVPASAQFSLSMVVSAGIAHALMRHMGGIRIKWPNDIYAGDDKIAGILIEHAVSGNRIGHTIAGIGMNVNQTVFTSDAPNPVSMKLISGIDYDTKVVLAEVLESVGRQYDLLTAGGKHAIEEEYNRLLYRKDEWHRFTSEGTVFTGMIMGVGESGELILKNGSGGVNSYLFREIEYIL
ncbi:MAG: biotin--[acetyl-CoA-carboxylase] ligase [Bacteroidetes bacterium]|nr:biotin--[acetyl-CoA-carboxylase] ligase [Bacteroidota bacterium]